MPVISLYHDFFVFLDRLAETRADPWLLYCQHYLEPHRAFLEAWWEQCMGKPVEVWQQRVENVRPEHYAGIRAMLSSCNPEAEAEEALRRCRKLLPASEPKVNLMIGFFSPDAFVIQVEGEWQIGLGLERLGDVKRIPLLVAHEYSHWYRRQAGLAQPRNLGERLIEEGLAAHLSSLAYPEHPLAQHLFIPQSRLRTFQDYQDSLLKAAFARLECTDEAEIQAFLYSHQPGKDLPSRPGGYVGYVLVSEYLRSGLEKPETVFNKPGFHFLEAIQQKTPNSNRT